MTAEVAKGRYWWVRSLRALEDVEGKPRDDLAVPEDMSSIDLSPLSLSRSISPLTHELWI